MHDKNNYWRAVNRIIAINQKTDCIQKNGKSGTMEYVVPTLTDPYWILIWFVLKAFDLKTCEITATATDGGWLLLDREQDKVQLVDTRQLSTNINY